MGPDCGKYIIFWITIESILRGLAVACVEWAAFSLKGSSGGHVCEIRLIQISRELKELKRGYVGFKIL